jgi:hypothetical protein
MNQHCRRFGIDIRFVGLETLEGIFRCFYRIGASGTFARDAWLSEASLSFFLISRRRDSGSSVATRGSALEVRVIGIERGSVAFRRFPLFVDVGMRNSDFGGVMMLMTKDCR